MAYRFHLNTLATALSIPGDNSQSKDSCIVSYTTNAVSQSPEVASLLNRTVVFTFFFSFEHCCQQPVSACILHGWNCIVEISASAAFYSLGPCLGRERGGPQPSQTEPWKLGSRLNHLTAGLSQRQGDQPRVRILTPQKPPRWPLASHSGEQEALLHHFLECQRKSPEKVDSLPPRRHSHGDNQPDACLPRHCSQFSVFSTALAKKEKKKKPALLASSRHSTS